MTTLSTLSSDIKTHFIGVVLVIGLILGSVFAVDSLIERHDAKTEAKYELLLKQADARTTADEQAYTATLTQLTAQNAALSASIVKANAALAIQLKADSTLTASAAAAKLGGTATPSGDVDLPLPAAQTVAAVVDEVPYLKEELLDETDIADNLQTELTAQTKVVVDLKAAVPVAQQACQAQIATVKATARKSKIKWFIAGVVAGFIGRGFSGV